MNWGKLIKDIREIQTLSQTEMAKALDVSFASVNRWENGHNSPTTSAKKKIKKIASQCNLSLNDYLEN
jgi:putative transcriptional regulator